MAEQIKYYTFKSFKEIYNWLKENYETEREMFCAVTRCNPEKLQPGQLHYFDAVNAALCFGWIDSTLRNIDGVLVQRFSQRNDKSHWTELNIKRCRVLYKKGLMVERGIKACPVDITR